MNDTWNKERSRIVQNANELELLKEREGNEIVQQPKSARIRWLGHVKRMED